MTADHLLTSEVARICEVSSQTVREWERAGRLPAQKTATGVRLFNPATVAAFAAKRSRPVSTGERVTDVRSLALAR